MTHFILLLTTFSWLMHSQESVKKKVRVFAINDRLGAALNYFYKQKFSSFLSLSYNTRAARCLFNEISSTIYFYVCLTECYAIFKFDFFSLISSFSFNFLSSSTRFILNCLMTMIFFFINFYFVPKKNSTI